MRLVDAPQLSEPRASYTYVNEDGKWRMGLAVVG